MAAVFLPPTVVEPIILSSTAFATAPASRVLLDEPGLVARAAGTLSMTFDMQAQPYDTVAIVRHNLSAAQTIRVRIGTDPAMSGGVVFDQTFAAWSGAAPFSRAISYLPLPRSFTERYVTVDLVGAAGADVEASRILIGQRIEIDGVDQGAQLNYASGSPVDDGPGWTTVGEQRSRIVWQVNAGNVARSAFKAAWAAFLHRVGKHAGFLFIPYDGSDSLQHEAALVRFKEDANVVDVSSSRNRVEMTLFEV